MPVLYHDSGDGAILQGEILSNVVELTLVNSADGQVQADKTVHSQVIVLSQDCDLEWDYKARQEVSPKEGKLISHILFCDLEDADTVRERSGARSKQLWDFITANREARYHRLDASTTASGQGLDEFYIDFKRVFSLRASYIYQGLAEGNIGRRGCLISPWREALSSRFTQFLARVALPTDED